MSNILQSTTLYLVDFKVFVECNSFQKVATNYLCVLILKII